MPLVLAIPIIAVLLAILFAAGSDMEHAADPEYDSKIGYDKGRGWVVMLGLIVAVLVAAGTLGCGPLAVLMSP